MAAFLKVDTGCREGNSGIPSVNFKILEHAHLLVLDHQVIVVYVRSALSVDVNVY